MSTIDTIEPKRSAAKPITVTVQTTCQLTGLGATKVNDLIRDEKLKSVTIGRRRLVFLTSIEALLRGEAA